MAIVAFKGFGGVRLQAETNGEELDPSVLLVHGLGRTRGVWDEVASGLVGAGRRVIALDLRGHGTSEWPADGRYEFDAHVEDLRAVLAQLGTRPVVVAATLGGWIATRAGGHFATGPTHIDDLVESIRAITPIGTWASRRLPGSGAGPSPDRQLLGSEGTLGVITEAWVRVQRRPEHRASRAVRFDGFLRGAQALRAIVQSGLRPANCRLLDELEAAGEAVVHDVVRRDDFIADLVEYHIPYFLVQGGIFSGESLLVPDMNMRNGGAGLYRVDHLLGDFLRGQRYAGILRPDDAGPHHVHADDDGLAHCRNFRLQVCEKSRLAEVLGYDFLYFVFV